MRTRETLKWILLSGMLMLSAGSSPAYTQELEGFEGLPGGELPDGWNFVEGQPRGAFAINTTDNGPSGVGKSSLQVDATATEASPTGIPGAWVQADATVDLKKEITVRFDMKLPNVSESDHAVLLFGGVGATTGFSAFQVHFAADRNRSSNDVFAYNARGRWAPCEKTNLVSPVPLCDGFSVLTGLANDQWYRVELYWAPISVSGNKVTGAFTGQVWSQNGVLVADWYAPRSQLDVNTGRFALGIMTGLARFDNVRVAHAPADAYTLHRLKAHRNAALARMALRRSKNCTDAWLDARVGLDAAPAGNAGLIPRQVMDKTHLWLPKDNAADNLCHMANSAYLTDSTTLSKDLLEILATERKYAVHPGTPRLAGSAGPDVMPRGYKLTAPQGLTNDSFNMLTFGASEYMKDGLMIAMELQGKDNKWFDRLTEIMDVNFGTWLDTHSFTLANGSKIPKAGNKLTDHGNIEALGEMLQTLPRLYWATGDKKYLDWAIRLGNHFLLDDANGVSHHPVDTLTYFSTKEHGNELLDGISALYASLAKADPALKATYEKPFYRFLDRVWELRKDDGSFWKIGDLVKGTGKETNDYTATYLYLGFYTAYMTDKNHPNPAIRAKVEKYRQGMIDYLTGFRYGERIGAGDPQNISDKLEGTFYLLNREIDQFKRNNSFLRLEAYIDEQMRRMHAYQDEKRYPDTGIFEGWYGDGNTIRTSLLYGLWKTQGVRTDRWNAKLLFGASRTTKGIILTVHSASPWSGKMILDKARHSLVLGRPIDYPSLNMYPEWYCVDPNGSYNVTPRGGTTRVVSGQKLLDGYDVSLAAGETIELLIEGTDAGPSGGTGIDDGGLAPGTIPVASAPRRSNWSRNGDAASY